MLRASALKIFYILYFFELGVIGKHARKDVGGPWKGPEIIAFEATKNAKRTS
jgi:hypothetical protein